MHDLLSCFHDKPFSCHDSPCPASLLRFQTLPAELLRSKTKRLILIQKPGGAGYGAYSYIRLPYSAAMLEFSKFLDQIVIDFRDRYCSLTALFFGSNARHRCVFPDGLILRKE